LPSDEIDIWPIHSGKKLGEVQMESCLDDRDGSEESNSCMVFQIIVRGFLSKLEKIGIEMPRPKGLPKTGGRAIGTPNRKTLEVTAKLDGLGCDRILGLAEIAMSPETAPELRVRCYSELAGYVHAKRRAVEIASEDDHEIRVTIERIGA
jgi:hypothetical protein